MRQRAVRLQSEHYLTSKKHMFPPFYIHCFSYNHVEVSSFQGSVIERFLTILHVMQVSNITKILKKNRLECKPKDTGLKDSIEDTKVLKVTEEDYNIPLKVLVTGKMVVLCLLTPPSVDNLTLDKGLCSVQYGQAVPLLVASLYNPLCALQLLEDGRSEAEMSLFNMSVSSHQEKISIGKYM